MATESSSQERIYLIIAKAGPNLDKAHCGTVGPAGEPCLLERRTEIPRAISVVRDHLNTLPLVFHDTCLLSSLRIEVPGVLKFASVSESLVNPRIYSSSVLQPSKSWSFETTDLDLDMKGCFSPLISIEEAFKEASRTQC